jgi:hypothetical protein
MIEINATSTGKIKQEEERKGVTFVFSHFPFLLLDLGSGGR